MPFRKSIRRALTFGSSDDDAATGSGSGSVWKFSSKRKDPRLKDPNVYQPGEKMPPLKYRRPVAPEHKAHLESFSWANAWRRRSEHSQYSPMGSRYVSRRNSRTTFGRRSIDSRRSEGAKSSRGNDGTGVDSGFGGSVSGATDRVDPVRENSDEESCITNVGISKVNSRNAPQRPGSDAQSDALSRHRSNSLSAHRSNSLSARRSASVRSYSPRADRGPRVMSLSRIDQPFTPEELESALSRSYLDAYTSPSEPAVALSRSYLDPTKEASDESGNGTPGLIEEEAQRRTVSVPVVA